jgi:aryl-alcohol dehydrogenase-like predicted oxidoreductase
LFTGRAGAAYSSENSARPSSLAARTATSSRRRPGTFLTGTIRSPEELADDDWRKNNPRFAEGNFEQNLRIVDEVEAEAVASEIGATPAQVALAWLLAQGDDIAPIPGTKRVSRVEENTAADAVDLSVEQIAPAERSRPGRRRAPQRGEHGYRRSLT